LQYNINNSTIHNSNTTFNPNNASIIKYYRECNNAYRDAWGLDKNLQLNLGLWKKGTRKLSQALYNLNEEVSSKARIHAESRVLDAGCGVGGTAIFMAQHFGCKVYGISLVPDQIKKAKENAKKAGVAHLCTFEVMDYMNTSFPDNYFDAISGIESICYAEPKSDFLKEAHRLLKKGGKLVLAENLQGKADLTPQEYACLYTHAFHGCKVQSLDTKEQYLKHLQQLKFATAHCEDYTALIRPSIARLRRFYYLAAAYNAVHRWIGKPFSSTQEANTKMCYYLQSSLKQGLWTYGIITAEK
jgi:cyclopropane fatty-acyl-phospholipid synthase-like methyltransferase